MNDLFFALLIFYSLIVMGYIFGRIFKKYNKELRRYFSYILLFILTPPLILFAFILPNESIKQPIVIFNIIIFQIILVFTTQLLAFLVLIRKKSSEFNQRKGSILSLVAFPNAFLFPLPIVLSLFGSEYIAILVVFSLSAMVLRSTLLTYQCIYYGNTMKKTFVENLKETLLFPPFLTIIISVLLNIFGVRLEYEIFYNINEILSLITSIFGALLIGLLLVNINFQKIHEFKKDFLLVFSIRVIYSFFLFLLITQFFVFPIMIRQSVLIILLLLFCDPPAVSNISYSEYFELDHEFTAFCVFTITILAVIYVPLLIFLGFVLF
ncbi:MAG: AEC family transporter [Candidatus Hermodarchaeota archaeon]